jgi:WXG100 family type VII secretion target
LANQTQAQAAVMAQTADKFRSTNANLADMLKRLMSELDGLQAGWKGVGAQAFDQTRLRWQEDMTKLHRALDETANAIQTAGTQYTSSDDGSAQRLKATQGANISLPL